MLPLGSLEQHGHHLPMLTDSMIGKAIADRAEAALGTEALFLPTLWCGASHHHLGFPGTISVSNATYVRLLVDILDSLVAAGFRRMLVLNAHGGNITPGRMAIYDVQMRNEATHGLWIAMTSWWQVAAEQIRSIPDLRQAEVTHACEQETSVLLWLRPDLVSMEKAHGANIAFDSAFYCPDFSRHSSVDVARPFHHLSDTGAFGHPELGTPAKGEAIVSVAADQVASLVREMSHWPAKIRA